MASINDDADGRKETALEDSVATPPVARRALVRVALGASAGSSLIFGTITSKIAAVTVGPAGVGYLALVQGTANFITVILGLELGAALMRVLPARLAAGDRTDVNCYLSVAARLVALTTVALVAAGLLLRHQLGALLFARPDASRTFALVLGAAAVYSWAMFIICIMAAHQATRSVVWATVLSAASTPVVSAIGYTAGGEQATPLILFASSSTSLVTTLLVAFIALHGKLRLGRAGKREGSHARQLLAFSLPKLLGTMSGAITAVAVPVLVGRLLGYQDAGQFRAAHTISLAFSSIAVLALFYDFFPRVSAVRDSADKFRRETVEELITMSALTTSVAIAVVLFAPLLVRILYSSSFDSTIDVLRVMVAAESIRVTASVLLTALSASVSGRLTGLASSLPAVVMLVALPWLLQTFGIIGVGLDSVLGNVTLLALCYVILVTHTSFRLPPRVAALLAFQAGLPFLTLLAARTASLALLSTVALLAVALVIGSWLALTGGHRNRVVIAARSRFR